MTYRIFVFASFLLIGFQPVMAQVVETADSSLKVTTVPDSVVVEPKVEPTVPFIISFDTDRIADLDYEEFGDLVAVLPGFYPLDQAGYAQPARAQFMGLSPAVVGIEFRGRELHDQLLGSPELGWIPPHSLAKLSMRSFPPGVSCAQLQAELKELENSPPSSHVGARDGYYGLGNVDFDLAVKITPTFGLNGGGEISTYGGRLPHTSGYGLNLRAEVVWRDSSKFSASDPGLWGWWGVAQNRRNAQVPYQSISYKRERYETDAVLHWRQQTLHGYGVQQIDTYGSTGEDLWEEIGLMTNSEYSYGKLRGDLSSQTAMARWRLKAMDWSTTSFGSLRHSLSWNILPPLELESHLGLDLSDDFAPARHLGLQSNLSILDQAQLFMGITQHQRMPSRFETSAAYSHEAHYLPYNPIFYQYPDLDAQGTNDLKNETYSNVVGGGRFESQFLSVNLSYVNFRIDDPIAWQAQGNQIKSYNATSEKSWGGLGSLLIFPIERIEIGTTGSYRNQASGEQRLFPEVISHAWAQYQQLAFKQQLDLRVRVWSDFWGQRWFPIPGGWEQRAADFTLSARISARLYGVQLFWGVNNIIDRKYELLPGYTVMHKEEVWGVSWNFKN